MTESNHPVGLQTLIRSLKQELLSSDPQDPNPLFAIDEITVTINFAVEGTDEEGASLLRVIEIGSEIKEQHTHTATIRLVSLLNQEQLLEKAIADDPEVVNAVKALRDWVDKKWQ